MAEEQEGQEGPENLDEPPAFFPYADEEPGHERVDLGELVECRIEGVFMAENAGQVSSFVLLSDDDRKLPILIGRAEATAIQLAFENSRPDRPMTHDLMRNIIERLESDLDRVVIDDFWNKIFYAKLYLVKGEEEFEVDARPSDAIALAVRFDAPIFVAEGILDAAMEE